MMPSHYEIKYLDDGKEHINYAGEYDLVAITALTPKASRAFEIADEFRKRGKYVVMGGPHASVLPEDAARHADSVFVGEAQFSWNDFIEDFMQGHPKPVYNGAGRYAAMTESPVPRYDLLNMENYKIIPVETTRGCPHDCEFCSSTKLWGRSYRRKNVAQVIREIEEVKRYANNKFLFFVDDNMFVQREFSYELLKAIRKYKLRWFAQSDISVSDDDKLLDLIYQAGCRELLIGFETISPDNLKTLDSSQWKLKQLARYPSAIEKIQAEGISIYGSFILGLDHDDESVFQRTRDFIINTNLLGFQILVMTPIPGTRVHERLKKENRLYPVKDWGTYSTYQLNYELKKMSRDTFEKGMLWLFRELYSEEAFNKRKMHYLKLIRNLKKS
ncbi:MAG: radical SAM protein [Desulfobacteraceae bacterium]|nr:MAG: radical SAM protein [Desulfobacteraceae bacterium]